MLAIVVGDLVSRNIGPRSHVWSEPALIEASAFEFTDTESFIEIAEKIVGPYVWGIYGKFCPGGREGYGIQYGDESGLIDE